MDLQDRRVTMHPRRLEHLLNDVDSLMLQLEHRAPELVERGHGHPDATGFPSRSLGGGGGSSEHTPTEAAALADYRVTCGATGCGRTLPCHEHAADLDAGAGGGHWTTQRDPVDDTIAAFEHQLITARDALRQAFKHVLAGEKLARTNRHANAPTECLACGRVVECTSTDRIRGGHCAACAEAWRRFRLKAHRDHKPDPDLIVWRRGRRRQIEKLEEQRQKETADAH